MVHGGQQPSNELVSLVPDDVVVKGEGDEIMLEEFVHDGAGSTASFTPDHPPSHIDLGVTLLEREEAMPIFDTTIHLINHRLIY